MIVWNWLMGHMAVVFAVIALMIWAAISDAASALREIADELRKLRKLRQSQSSALEQIAGELPHCSEAVDTSLET